MKVSFQAQRLRRESRMSSQLCSVSWCCHWRWSFAWIASIACFGCFLSFAWIKWEDIERPHRSHFLFFCLFLFLSMLDLLVNSYTVVWISVRLLLSKRVTLWEKGHDSNREHIRVQRKPSHASNASRKTLITNLQWSKEAFKHFKASHFMDCKFNSCDLTVLHEMHLKQHAQDVHRLQTRDLDFTVLGRFGGWLVNILEELFLYQLAFDWRIFPVGL